MEDNDPTEIYCLSHSCDEIFDRITEDPAARSLMVIEVLHERFNQWASHLGVFARDAGRPKVSLDARLMHSESLRSMVIRYLVIAEKNLNYIKSIENEPSDNMDGETPSSIVNGMNRKLGEGLSSLLVESLQALESAVDGLYRLGIAIRQSSPGNLTQRINAFNQKKNDGMLEAMVFLHLKHRLVDKIKEGARTGDNPNAQIVGASLSLCRQLAASVSFRYFGILYRRSHAQKIEVNRGTKPQTKWTQKTAVPKPNTVVPKSSPVEPTTTKPSAITPHSHIIAPLSNTEPSIPESKMARQIFASSKRPFTGAPSVISIRPRDVKYPDPPKVFSPARDKACPYCCQRFPKANYESKQWWQRHIEDDFKLYTCISEECADPPQLFARFDDWRRHMDGNHTTKWMQKVHRSLSWCCERDHDDLWFTDESEFGKHIQSKHPDYAEGPGLEMFKEWCEVRRSRRPDTCPVCNCVPDKIAKITLRAGQETSTASTGESHRGSTQERSDLREELIRHVGEHIKQVGFMSIDYIQDNDEGDVQASGNASSKADDNKNSLEKGKWINGEWVPTDTELAAYMDPETLAVPPAPELLNEELDWRCVWESDACLQQSGPEQELRQTLELAGKLLGTEHRDTITCRSHLAKWLESERRFGEAEIEFRRVFESRMEMLRLERDVIGLEQDMVRLGHDVIVSIYDLSRVLRYLGRSEESARLEHDAGRLGTRFKWTGSMAEKMNRRALEGYEKVLGVEHLDTLTSISNLALVLRGQGKYEEAEKMNRRALEGYEKALGAEHPYTLTSISNLALVLQGKGKYEEAEKMNRRALEGYEKMLGVEHLDTLTSISSLALVLRGRGMYEEAEKMIRRALEGYEKALGAKHPDTLTSISNLASVLRGQGKYEEAEKMNRQALEQYEKVLGTEHPDTLTSISNLALVLRGQKKYEEAEKMNRRALEGYEKVLGAEHPNTLTSISNLALVLRGQGKYEEAEKMNRRALEGREKALEAKHPHILTSTSNPGLILQDQGKHEETEDEATSTIGHHSRTPL